MAMTILISALAVCGVFLVAWAVAEAFMIRMPKNAFHIIYLNGDDAEVEQNIRTCLWMRRHHGLTGQMLFVDCGISVQSQITAQLMLKDDEDICICAPSQLTQYLRWENEAIGTGAD